MEAGRGSNFAEAAPRPNMRGWQEGTTGDDDRSLMAGEEGPSFLASEDGTGADSSRGSHCL